MSAQQFFDDLAQIFALSPVERHTQMLRLHTQVLLQYRAALQRITPQQAIEAVHAGEDQRSLMQVIAHIAEWERFILLACGEILSGVTSPRLLGKLDGYIDLQAQAHAFSSINDFNALQAAQYRDAEWDKVRNLAENTASALYALFSTPELLNAERLERTRPARQRIPGRDPITTTAGWVLWCIVLEHPGADHAQELGITVN